MKNYLIPVLLAVAMALAACVAEDSPLAKVGYTIKNADGEVLVENLVVPGGRCWNVSLPATDGETTIGGGSAAVTLSTGETGPASVAVGDGCAKVKTDTDDAADDPS